MMPPGFYCERLSDGLLGEPLNALSNLGFLLAAWAAWHSASGALGDGRLAVRLLAALLGLVGVASLAFHTLATPTAGLLDVAFIGLFNLSYLLLFVRRVLGGSSWLALACGAGFLALDAARGALLPAGTLHGSAIYLPPLLVLALLILASRQRAPAAARLMLQAAALFALSLTARTLDQPLCPVWPPGLHFLWHLINAAVLLRLVQAFQAGLAVRLPLPGADGAPRNLTVEP